MIEFYFKDPYYIHILSIKRVVDDDTKYEEITTRQKWR